MKFSKVYYTRYHIWQNLVAAVGDNIPSPEVMAKLAQEGFDFIWQDGTDVWEEEETEENPNQLTIKEDGTWSSGAYL